MQPKDLNAKATALNEYVRTAEGAMTVAAGAITAAAVGATGYFGGKAALTTGAVVGGGIVATAVVFTSVKMLLGFAGKGIALAQSKVEKAAAAKPDLAGGKQAVAA